MNPDADLRYVLPDLLVARCDGIVSDDAYDYVDDGSGNMLMLVFLQTDDPESAVSRVVDVLRAERVMGNDLSAVPIAVDDGAGVLRVVHPPGFAGTFHRQP
jgi:hypothetical protein